MADSRTFVLIGNFTDNITPALENINKSINKLKKNLSSISKATKPLKDDFKDLASLSRNFSTSLKTQAADIKAVTSAMRAMRNEMGRVDRAYKAAGRRRGVVPPPPPPPRTPRGALSAPPSRPPQYTPPAGGRRPPAAGRYGRESVLGDVISGTLISNAIIQGFQVGVGILQRGMSAALGAFTERARDQLEDIGAAGGIYSAGQFANIPGFPKTFQGAMDMQDRINKEMATIASNLPGTTHDYVTNSRRLVDTTAQIMARDLQDFTKLATELTGKANISAEEAFRVVNVEVAKATTMLEKINPARTVIPMSQLVEDMMKDEQVTIEGLRRYVAFRRGTTFEAALQRNINELNKTGAGTADRLKMIIKVLKQAAPPEMIGAFQASVAGVTEGFRSALMDPDVGLFGLSRTLAFEVKKFDRETGKHIGKEYTNFFKLFSEVFGNIGNLINTAIMPGLQALYPPFEAIAKQFIKLREFSYRIFERQQRYTAYFDQLADKYGMRREDFKVFEKGGVGVLMDILQGFNMLSDEKYRKIVSKMEKKGTAEQVAQNMKEVYADIIPAIFESPFFKNIGTVLGRALAEVFKEIAKIMKALLQGEYGVSQFTKAFYEAGGMDAINEILMYVAEGIGKLLMKLVELYFGALTKAIGSGNFAAAGVLGALGLVFGGPAIAGIKIIAKGMQILVNAFRMLLASRVVPTNVKDLGTRITDPRKLLPAGKALPGTAAGGEAASAAARTGWFAKTLKNIKGFGVAATKLAKGIPFLGLAITALDFSIRKASGQKVGAAAGGAIGSTVLGTAGAILGSAGGPAGTVAGGVIGSYLGSWIGSVTGTAFDKVVETVSSIKWGEILPKDLEDLTTRAKQTGGQVKVNLLDAIYNIGAAIRFFDQKTKQMKASASSSKNSLEQAAQQIAQGFSNAAKKVGTGLVNAVIAINNLDWGSIGEAIRDGIDKLKSKIPGLQNWARNIWQEGQNALNRGLSGQPQNPAKRQPAASGAYGHGGMTSLGNAISTEMRNKPVGSHLVIANSSEMVIPAAGGFIPKMDKMTNAIAEVRYGMGKPAGGASKNWMQILDEDYKKNLNKPYNPYGTVKNSGRGGLDTWGGPGAYISPKSLAPVASAGGGGGSVNVNSPVTIHQQPGQNAEELAAIVAQKIGDAVAEAKASSMFV